MIQTHPGISWVHHGKTNNQPEVGGWLITTHLSGKIGDGSLFWSLHGIVHHIILPFSKPAVVRTCQIQEHSTRVSAVLNHPNHPKEVEPNVRDAYFWQCRVDLNTYQLWATKSDNVNH